MGEFISKMAYMPARGEVFAQFANVAALDCGKGRSIAENADYCPTMACGSDYPRSETPDRSSSCGVVNGVFRSMYMTSGRNGSCSPLMAKSDGLPIMGSTQSNNGMVKEI
jgi:hypothetical protein